MSEGIPDGWQLTSVEKICKTSAGGTPSTQVPEYWVDGTVPWMSSGEVHKKRVKHVDQCITELGLINSSAKLFPPKTILMALAGQGKTRGTVAIGEIELTTNQSIAGIMVNKPDVDPYFVYYNLDGRYNELRTASGGSGRAGLNLRIINDLKILTPPKPEQQKIASILTSVDAVIEKTESQISKLSDLKKGMMQELLAKGIGHTEFKDSPVGRIPKEWEVLRIGEIAIVKGGKRMPKGKPFADGKTPYPYIRVSDFMDGTIRKSELKYVLPEDQVKIKRYTISKDDVYISIAGSLGIVGTIPDELDKAQLTENAAKIIFKDKSTVDKEFFMYLLQSDVCQEQFFQSKGTGGGVPKLALFRIEATAVPFPKKSEQSEIADTLQSIDSRIDAKKRVQLVNQHLKKALMQDLLTGKVRVKVN